MSRALKILNMARQPLVEKNNVSPQCTRFNDFETDLNNKQQVCMLLDKNNEPQSILPAYQQHVTSSNSLQAIEFSQPFSVVPYSNMDLIESETVIELQNVIVETIPHEDQSTKNFSFWEGNNNILLNTHNINERRSETAITDNSLELNFAGNQRPTELVPSVGEEYYYTIVDKEVSNSKQLDVTEENENIRNEEIYTQEENQNQKRKKRHNVKEDTWKAKKYKLHREKGMEYKGKRKIDGKWKYDIEKNKRVMKQRCNCVATKKGVLKCATFTEEERKSLFRKFWSITWAEKKLFVDFLTDINSTRRPRDRKISEISRRSCSITYFLKRKDEKVRVCKTMFHNTLGVGGWCIRNWKKNVEEDTHNATVQDDQLIKEANNAIVSRKSKVAEKRHQLFQHQKESLIDFLNTLPKMESHYCRSSSKKMYLEPLFRSKLHLYDIYQNDWCKNQNVKHLSLATFTHIYHDMNLSLYQPKKDLCNICVGFKTGNITEEQHNLHQIKKKEARQEKERDKMEEESVFTMDLQSVLLSPMSRVSAIYYKTKLVVHNFTIFNLKTKDGYCYVWNETEGGLTSNEFASILCRFILTHIVNGTNKIIIYSDGCTYQNRNSNLANALLNISVLKNIVIEQKYLEKGHTQMEADSMHSSIERQLRKLDINVPAEYVNVFKRARKIPRPYVVEYLDHTFFKDVSQLKYYNTIRPGKLVRDPVVTDIRALQYCPDGTIKYKLRFSDTWMLLPVRKRQAFAAIQYDDIPNLYRERLPVKKTKFDHLQALKSTLEVDYHSFYDNIPFV